MRLFCAFKFIFSHRIIILYFAISEKSDTFAFLTRRYILPVPLSDLATGYRKAHTSPDGGIGRRAGLKHQWSNPCRFDPGSGYPTKCKCLIFKHLHFSFSFLHHVCTTEWAVLGQNLCFSKIFLERPLASAYLDAKLVKVVVNRKNVSKLREFPSSHTSESRTQESLKWQFIVRYELT